MERDLFAHMEALQSGAESLTAELDARLQALISTMYSDDPHEGGARMSQLSEYRARDRVVEQPSQASHPNEESNKRAATQVISAVQKRLESKALAKRMKTSHQVRSGAQQFATSAYNKPPKFTGRPSGSGN